MNIDIETFVVWKLRPIKLTLERTTYRRIHDVIHQDRQLLLVLLERKIMQVKINQGKYIIQTGLFVQNKTKK